MNRSTAQGEAAPSGGLSLEAIVDVTTRIMRSEGLEKATMRRVAHELGTGPASLYVYIANTTELHAAVLDRLIGTMHAPREGTWREGIRDLLFQYAELLFTYPGLARSALTTRPSGPQSIWFYDQLLGLLLAGEIEPSRAAWGVKLLIQHVEAAAAESTLRNRATPAAKRDWASLTSAVTGANPESAPFLSEHAALVLSGTPRSRNSWALDVLIAGIADTPTPTD